MIISLILLKLEQVYRYHFKKSGIFNCPDGDVDNFVLKTKLKKKKKIVLVFSLIVKKNLIS